MPRFEAIDVELRQRWPETGRVVLIHRTGTLGLGESSVIVVVSAPHRPEAFEAARFAIDALKLTAPIWKHEVWQDGADWGIAAGAPVDATSVPTRPVSGSRRDSRHRAAAVVLLVAIGLIAYLAVLVRTPVSRASVATSMRCRPSRAAK